MLAIYNVFPYGVMSLAHTPPQPVHHRHLRTRTWPHARTVRCCAFPCTPPPAALPLIRRYRASAHTHHTHHIPRPAHYAAAAAWAYSTRPVGERLDVLATTPPQAAAVRTPPSPARASMIDAKPLTVLLVARPPRSPTSFGPSPVRTGGRPTPEGESTDLRIYL